MRIYRQKEVDSTCFLVALQNCASHLNLKANKNFVSLIHKYKDLCSSGPLLNKKQAVYNLRIPLSNVPTPESVFVSGGIFGIMHPIFNGHAVFGVPIGREYIVLYNSWLGPEVMTVSWHEFKPFCVDNLGGHWVIDKALYKKCALRLDGRPYNL